MQTVFNWVYHAFKWIESSTGLSYHEVNILVYYFIVPTLFIGLIAYVAKRKYLLAYWLLTITVLLVLLPDFSTFATWLFRLSESFLNSFDVIGLNYVQASVLICVFIPLLLLLYLAWTISQKKRIKK